MIRSFTTSVLSFALVVTLMTGCDNPACVFSANGCTSGGAGGGVGSEAASVPVDGEELISTLPTLVKFAPSGTSVDPKSPIVLTFSESMASTNLSSAFELNAGGLGIVPLVAATLIGDGHVVVLFPQLDLQLGTEFTILYRGTVVVADRTGQAVVQPTDREIGSFSTAATAPALPTVVATWPEDASTNESPTGEIDVVFSRPMDQTSIVDASWVVTVGGSAPANDPAPQPITISGLVTDSRVYRWRSTDASSVAVSLGTDAEVQLELAPTGQAIKDTAGNSLANKVITYRTLSFAPPTGGAITSFPGDAIGIDQVSGPQDLAVRVDFTGAQAGDRVGVYMFGREPQPNPPIDVANLRIIALFRELPLVTPFTSFTFTAAELDLVRTQSPLAPRFTDGSITFAFYLRRGNVVSPIKVLDVDATTKGTQSPVLDTIPPTILGFSTSGTTISSFRSDQRGIVIVGRASEALRAVSVVTPLGSNEVTMGEPAPVVGSNASGLFIAAPVDVGVLTPAQSPQNYTIQAFDRALNGAGTITGQFTQVGQASNGATSFTNVTVEVVRADTLAPIVGATVIVHESNGGTVGFVAANVTASNGRVTLPASISGETIVSVDARTQGFDPFTFDGVTSDHVSIPLRTSLLANGSVSGSVNTTDANFAAYTKSVGDTRFPAIGETLLTAGSCTFSTQAQALLCAFGPTAIRSREIGAVSAVVVFEPPSPLLFNAATFLRAFQLSIPVGPVEPTTTQQVVIATGTSLDSVTLDPEESPIDVPALTFNTASYPTLSGTPRVRVEATAPGIGRAVTVGRGISFNDALPTNTYGIRAAYPGSCDGVADAPTDKLGRFVTSGTIDADLLVRAEAVDTAGNRGGVRPRLSVAPGPLVPLVPPAPPTPDATPFVANAGPAADFRFADTLAFGEPGLHKAVFTDSTGAAWTVWRVDGSGAQTVMHLPRIAAGGTFPLAAGTWSVRVSSFSWPTLDTANFLWSDVEREFSHFAHAASLSTPAP